MNTFNDFWIPTTGEELQSLASVLATSPREAQDLIKCHAWFGHYFGGHLGKVQANVSIISGKPALLSDALVGICYAQNLVRRIEVVSSNDQHCTVEAERRDEPAGTIHRFTFTMQMAQQMNLVKASWHKQPANMLKKRARAWIVREVFPEAVSGLYTVDEMADHANLSDAEIEELHARSFGYDGELNRSSRPQPVAPVRPTTPPSKPAPVVEEVAEQTVYQFDTVDQFWEAVECEDIERTEVEAKIESLKLDLSTMTADQREKLYYGNIRHNAIRRSVMLPLVWQESSMDHLKSLHGGLSSQYPILKEIPMTWLKYRLDCAPFVEAITIAIDADQSKVIKALQESDPTDWSLFDYVKDLIES